jgi:hypothetical protein
MDRKKESSMSSEQPNGQSNAGQRGLSKRARVSLLIIGPLVALLGVKAITWAAAALKTWNDGDTLTAADLNGNFKALNDRVTTLEAAQGCADGTVDQAWPSSTAMVGCDAAGHTDAGVAPLAIRFADTLCSHGWHVCELAEWNARRATTLSNQKRWLRASITCGSTACSGDVGLEGMANDVCDLTNSTSCANNYAFYVGPTPTDYMCTNWPAGINNGNLGRSAAFGNNKQACLATLDTTVVGVMCCL